MEEDQEEMTSRENENSNAGSPPLSFLEDDSGEATNSSDDSPPLTYLEDSSSAAPASSTLGRVYELPQPFMSDSESDRDIPLPPHIVGLPVQEEQHVSSPRVFASGSMQRKNVRQESGQSPSRLQNVDLDAAAVALARQPFDEHFSSADTHVAGNLTPMLGGYESSIAPSDDDISIPQAPDDLPPTSFEPISQEEELRAVSNASQQDNRDAIPDSGGEYSDDTSNEGRDHSLATFATAAAAPLAVLAAANGAQVQQPPHALDSDSSSIPPLPEDPLPQFRSFDGEPLPMLEMDEAPPPPPPPPSEFMQLDVASGNAVPQFTDSQPTGVISPTPVKVPPSPDASSTASGPVKEVMVPDRSKTPVTSNTSVSGGITADSTMADSCVSAMEDDVTDPMSVDAKSVPTTASDNDGRAGWFSGRIKWIVLVLTILGLAGALVAVLLTVRNNSNDDNSQVSSGVGSGGNVPTESPTGTPTESSTPFRTEELNGGLVSECKQEPDEDQFSSRTILFQYVLQVLPDSDASSIVGDVQDNLHSALAQDLLTCTFGRRRLESIEFLSLATTPSDALSDDTCPEGPLNEPDCYVVDAGFTVFYVGDPVEDNELVDAILPSLTTQFETGGAVREAHANITQVAGPVLVDPRLVFPTAAPTVAPTTSAPIAQPTNSPSKQPTPAPSKAPSDSTKSPSEETKAPSFTGAPVLPTDAPVLPTDAPNGPPVVGPPISPTPPPAPTGSSTTPQPAQSPITPPAPTPPPSELRPPSLPMPTLSEPTIEPTPEPTDEPTLAEDPGEGSDRRTYIPGRLVVEERGLRLSQGLESRVIAIANYNVPLQNGARSNDPFHNAPGSGACVFHPFDGMDSGWAYVSNSDLDDGNGGTGALYFDKDGKLFDYQLLLSGTSGNNGGGSTPWQSFVSAEENAAQGQGFWEVDPWQRRIPRLTRLGDRVPAQWGNFAYDYRNGNDPKYFYTEATDDGPVQRFSPSPDSLSLVWWRELFIPGYTLEYLVLSPENGSGGSFSWSQSEADGRESAFNHYPDTKAIAVYKRTMQFISRKLNQLFILDLDDGTYTVSSIQGGTIDGLAGDQIVVVPQKASNSNTFPVTYFTEKGRSNGIHARYPDGTWAEILEAKDFRSDETVGVALSPDGRYMYFALRRAAVVFQIWRSDGYGFDDPPLDVN